jgi:hypothetical protein
MTKRPQSLTSPKDEASLGEEQSSLDEWGIPDWRVASTYGNVRCWSKDRWRWEFYRRREDLRKYFDRWAEVNFREGLRANEGRTPSDPGFLVFGKDEEEGRGIKDFGYGGVPNPRIGPQPRISIMPFKNLIIPQRFYDPHKREPSSRGVLEVVGKQTAKEYHVWLEESEMAIKFDLNEPLAVQIENAHQALRKKQKEIHGKLLRNPEHRGKWLAYIRTLDARAAGATWGDIATIHPETAQTEQSARDRWKSADTLRFSF